MERLRVVALCELDDLSLAERAGAELDRLADGEIVEVPERLG